MNVSAVINVCKEAKHPITSRTIAKKLGIKPKHAKAALYEAKRALTMSLRNELNARHKRPIWSYTK